MSKIHEMIRERYRRMETLHRQFSNDLESFMVFPEPGKASNLVRDMSVLARMAQGYQDMTDMADLPRGHKPFEESE